MDADELFRAQQRAIKQLVKQGAAVDDALDEVARRKERLRSYVRASAALGMTEVDIARYAGISRPTVRDWLGKT